MPQILACPPDRVEKGSSEQRQSWETFQKGKDIKPWGSVPIIVALVSHHTVAQASIAIITLIMAALISTPTLDVALEEAAMDMDVTDLAAPGLELLLKDFFLTPFHFGYFRAAASHYRHLEHYHRSLAAAYHHSADDALRCHPCWNVFNHKQYTEYTIILSANKLLWLLCNSI